MDLGASQGGLPPDSVVEDIDAVLDATESAITRFHDPAYDAMVRVAVAPCSPFSVTAKLMTEAADLARRHGVRLHTHLAETDDEESFCRERFGASPTEYVDSLGWLGEDVWMAHAVHLDDAAVERFAATGTGVAHCPSSNARLGAGIARTANWSTPAYRWASAWTAPRRTRPFADRGAAARALFARARGGPKAMSVRETLRLATMGGARCWAGPTSGRSRWASSPTWCCGGSTAWPTRASTTRWPHWPSARRRRSNWPWSAAGRSSRATGWSTPRRGRAGEGTPWASVAAAAGEEHPMTAPVSERRSGPTAVWAPTRPGPMAP